MGLSCAVGVDGHCHGLTLPGCPLRQVGVVQFSTDSRVERPLAPLGSDATQLSTQLDAIVSVRAASCGLQ